MITNNKSMKYYRRRNINSLSLIVLIHCTNNVQISIKMPVKL